MSYSGCIGSFWAKNACPYAWLWRSQTGQEPYTIGGQWILRQAELIENYLVITLDSGESRIKSLP